MILFVYLVKLKISHKLTLVPVAVTIYLGRILMRLLISLIIFLCALNLTFSSDVYENQNSFNYEVTHFHNNDTLNYDLNLKSDNDESSSKHSWTWTLNYTYMPGSEQKMTSQTVTFEPIIDLSSIFPVKETSKVDLSTFKAFELSLPPLVNVVDLDKKILEPKVVLPLFKNSTNAKILKRSKKTTVKQTIIKSSSEKSDDPSYESETKELEVDKSELADCTYIVKEESKYKSSVGMLDVWVIECECKELNESEFINKATYYYNLEYGFVYFDIELKNDKIKIELKDKAN